MRIDPEVVETLAVERAAELLERCLLQGDLRVVEGGGIARVEPDLRPELEQRLDDAWQQPGVGLRRGAVLRHVEPGKNEEDGLSTAGALELDDVLEAPVRIGTAKLVERNAREPPSLAPRLARVTRKHGALQAARTAADPLPRPAPRDVDVVAQRYGEPGAAAPMGRLDPERAPQALERGVERVEARSGGGKPAVCIPRAAPLLEARQMEERDGYVVALRLYALRDLLPGALVVGNVVAEAELCRPDRVEHPPRPALDLRRDHRRIAFPTRAR